MYMSKASNAPLSNNFQDVDNLGILSAILSVLSLHYYNSTFEPFLFNLLKTKDNEKSPVRDLFENFENKIDKGKIIRHVNEKSSEFVIRAYSGGLKTMVTTKNLKAYTDETKQSIQKDSDKLFNTNVRWGYVKTTRNINCYIIRINKLLCVVIRNLNDITGWGEIGGGFGGVMNKFHLKNIDEMPEEALRHRSGKIEEQYLQREEFKQPLVHRGYLEMLQGKGGDGNNTYASDKILDMMIRLKNSKNDENGDVDKIIFSGQSAAGALLYMITYQLFKNEKYKENFGEKATHVVTWNSTRPGNTEFSNKWIEAAISLKSNNVTHSPYFTNRALEPCAPAIKRRSGLSRIYTPVKGFINKDDAKKKIRPLITETSDTIITKILVPNQIFRSNKFPPKSGENQWLTKKDQLNEKFGIKVTQKYKDINLTEKQVGDTTKIGMGGLFPGSGEIGYILIYMTWKIFLSRNCARRPGRKGYCTEITAENSRELEDLFPEIIVNGNTPQGILSELFKNLPSDLQNEIKAIQGTVPTGKRVSEPEPEPEQEPEPEPEPEQVPAGGARMKRKNKKTSRKSRKKNKKRKKKKTRKKRKTHRKRK